ncbi:D-alanyl-D-alanine carboxypeptidase/D-alanyl-D-alanine-endopeptidase [Terrimonas rubra]|uniref:D-alanyl-D-alanine carboxypeptidase/D-alanyl-D-alanine-endopeptidase n=1 Tax=Terrimonas rubra TaxID=1035890 RepID=A0ABW6A8K6_9BACT
MHRFLLLLFLIIQTVGVPAQTVGAKIAAAFNNFEKDTLYQNASVSLYVIEAATGKLVFDKNSRMGLAPASTQKIITSVSAYELLGQDYKFITNIGYTGAIANGVLKGDLIVSGSGDPTLGSWRWESTKPDNVLDEWIKKLKATGIQKIDGRLQVNTGSFVYQAIPDGWIWQDIGNYYGTGAYALNWKENQFDLQLTSGNAVGDAVLVKKDGAPVDYHNELRAAAKGTGDNAYLYFDGSISGTIPAGEKNFTISAADTNPAATLLTDLDLRLKASGMVNKTELTDGHDRSKSHGANAAGVIIKPVVQQVSPVMDSIIYWFNKKSINLYGEALIKAIALQNNKPAATDEGVKLVRDFWKQQGIGSGELNMKDGSGLSPLNRVTTHAQVEILKYARGKSWFPAFYDALPEYNGMKMKSGTISGVKGFCGYHKAKDGKEYIYSFLVNNYQGSASGLVQKMYKVLNELK